MGTLKEENIDSLKKSESKITAKSIKVRAGIYQVNGRFRVEIQRAGFKRRTKVFELYPEAKKWQDEQNHALNSGKTINFDVKKARVTTVQSLFERYRDEVIRYKDTDGRIIEGREGKKDNHNSLNRFIETAAFMRRRLSQLTAKDIDAWPVVKKEKIEQIQAKKDNSAKLVAVGVR